MGPRNDRLSPPLEASMQPAPAGQTKDNIRFRSQNWFGNYKGIRLSIVTAPLREVGRETANLI
jgi:hypothetical protein